MTTLAVKSASQQPPLNKPHSFISGDLPRFREDAIKFFYNVGMTHGPIARVRYLWIYQYVLTHPDYLQHVLQTNNRNYTKEQTLVQAVNLAGENLFSTDGDEWLKRRRLMQPAFHKQRLEAFGEMMTEVTQWKVGEWLAAANRTIELEHEMKDLTMNIIGRAMLSLDMRQRADQLHAAFNITSGFIIKQLQNPLHPPLWVPTADNRRFIKGRNTVNGTLDRVIQERLDTKAVQGDLLDMLLATLAEEKEGQITLSRAELLGELAGIVFAGHETTATTLTWLFYLLSQHPDVEAKLHEELDRVLCGRVPTFADLPHLTYTRMVIDETMRLYPAAWTLTRQAVNADEIGGYPIPAQSSILLNIYTVHHHPDFWENPETFDPERFTPERSADRHKFAFLPFGGGPRKCIGEPFALAEAQLVTATIAQQYRLRLLPGQDTSPFALFVLQTRQGLRMQLERR